MRLQEEMDAKLRAIEEMEERERIKNEELNKWQSEVCFKRVYGININYFKYQFNIVFELNGVNVKKN